VCECVCVCVCVGVRVFWFVCVCVCVLRAAQWGRRESDNTLSIAPANPAFESAGAPFENLLNITPSCSRARASYPAVASNDFGSPADTPSSLSSLPRLPVAVDGGGGGGGGGGDVKRG
jgi:hypothetical protein